MSRLAAPALLSLIVILFYWKLLFTDHYTWLDSADFVDQVLPWFQFQASEWHAGRIPLWDPTSWYGQSLLGQGQPGAAYPLNWLLFWMPLQDGFVRRGALHWYYVLVRVLAALSAYALCRELGRSRRASVLGGCLYALGGYVGNTDWPQQVNGAITSPLVFLYLIRAERTRAWRDAVLSGFFTGFGWLAGHHQMNLLITLAAIGLWTWLTIRDWRIARLVGAAMLIAILASAAQTLPMAEYGKLAVRWVGAPNDPIAFDERVPYSVHEQYSLKPAGLLAVFLPDKTDRFNPYMGAVGFALAVLGSIMAWRERQVRWLVFLALSGLLYALGSHTWFHGWLYSFVPLVEKARVPAAGTIVFAVCVAPLAAFGLDARMGKVFTDLRSGVGLIALSLFELSNVTGARFPDSRIPEQNFRLHQLSEHADIAEFLKSARQPGRVEYDGDLIPYNFGAWHGLETAEASSASAPANLWRADMFSPRSRDLFGVRYFIGKAPKRPDQREVFKGSRGINVYENPGAFPRAFSVHQAIVEPKLADSAVDLRRMALLPSAPRQSLEDCAPERDEIAIAAYTPNAVSLNAQMGCRGLVILTDLWFPGWSATIDGTRTEILEANGAVRAVLVDGGAHRIEMRYRPWSVILGAIASIGALTILLFFATINRRR